MKEIKDKLSVERLGHILSNGVRQDNSAAGECLSAPDIAALVDGRVSGEERDTKMKHLSSCETCYEIFVLTAGLLEEEETPMIKQRTFARYKPMALAASILIVVVAVYIFYQDADIPKTEDAFFEMTDRVEKKAPEAGAPGKAASRDMKNLSPSPKASGYRRQKVKASQKMMVAPKKSEDKAKYKNEKEKDAFAAGEEEVRAKKVGEKRRDIPDDGLGMTGLRKKGKAAAPRPMKPKLQSQQLPALGKTDPDQALKDIETAPAAKRERAFKTEEFQQRKEGTTAAVQAVVEESPQLRLARLNRIAQRTPGYVQPTGLEQVFRQTLATNAQLRRQPPEPKEGNVQQNVQQSLPTARDPMSFNKKQDALARYKPLANVVRRQGNIYVIPDVRYLLSRSEPGSVEHRFFKLALSGWCDNQGVCYRGESVITDFGSTAAKKSLLSRWQNLYPHLTGVFKEIAELTIAHLKR
jgi:hypothetical protein